MRSKVELTHARLLEVLNYDRATGVFTWKVRAARNIIIGSKAGGDGGHGYQYIKVDKRDYTVQKLVWFYVHGEWPKGPIRSVTGDKGETRIEFLRDSGYPMEGKFDHRTKEGRAAYQKSAREADPNRFRAQDLKKSFGIGLDDYQRMFVEQKGVCAVCAQPETATRAGKVKWLSVDHDHKTGDVRGLLCSDCNTGIGKLKDDSAVLRAAADYLDFHKARKLAEVETSNVVPLGKRN
jgi:hypothetical protein